MRLLAEPSVNTEIQRVIIMMLSLCRGKNNLSTRVSTPLVPPLVFLMSVVARGIVARGIVARVIMRFLVHIISCIILCLMC